MQEWLIEVGVEMGRRPDSQVCDALLAIVPELVERDASVSTFETGAIGMLWVEAPDALAAQDDARQVVKLIAAKTGGFATLVQVRSIDLVAAEVHRPTLPTLLGSSEVGELLGVSRQRVHQLHREHPEFPPPLVQVSMGPLWDEAAVEKFAQVWDRRPGRRRVTAM